MDINIIYDILSEYSPKLIINNTELQDVEICFDCSVAFEECNSYTLHVASAQQFYAHFELLKDCPMVIIGEIDSRLLCLMTSNVILISDRNIMLSSILNKLYSLLRKYNDWHERLLKTVIESQSLECLFKIGAEVFDNPIFMEDMESRLMAEVSLDTVESDNDFLHQLYVKRFVDTQDFIKYSSVNEENTLYSAPDFTPTFLCSPKNKYRMLVTYISHKNQRFAAFQVIESNHQITDGDIAYAKVFSHMLARYFNKSNIYEGGHATNPTVIENLIKGVIVSENELFSFLTSHGLAADAPYIIAAITWKDPHYGNPYTKQRLLFDLQCLFQDAELYLSQDYFFLIFYCNEAFEYELFMSELKSIADRNCLYVGVSQTFFDFKFFSKYYLQSLFVLDKAISDADENVIDYASCISYVMTEFLMTAQKSCGNIILSQIEALDAMDADSNNKYVETLFTYITCGFNHLRTALILNIHRNTLTYRLDKIKSIHGINLSKGSLSDTEIMTYLISCYLLIERRKKDL